MADPYAQFLAIPQGTEVDPYGSFEPVRETQGTDWTAFKDWKSAKAAIDELPEGERDTARKEWARQLVTKERENGGVMQRADDLVRRLSRGIVGGTWLGEGNAAIASKLGIADYDQQLAYENAKDQIGDDTSTKLGTLPLIGDVHTSGITKLAGGILSAPVTPVLKVKAGTTMLPNMINLGVTGGVYGGIQGSGDGDTIGERAMNTIVGGAVGAGVGAATAPVARAVGNAVEYVGNKYKGLPGELAGLDKGSVVRVARAATDDDLLANYRQFADDLGPEGMLADMGPNLRGQAAAIANQPGAGQRIIKEGQTTRTEGAAGRIRSDIDAAFGPEQNLVKLEADTVEAANKASGPHFNEFYKQVIPTSPKLQDIEKRLPRRVIERAEEIAQTRGETLTRKIQRPGTTVDDLTPRERRDLAELRETIGEISPDDAPTLFNMYEYVREAGKLMGKRPQSLSDWLIKSGGIKNQGDEVKYILGRVKDRPGLVSNKGRDLDAAAMAAWEAGFIKTPERPTIAQFLEALDDDLSGITRVTRDADGQLFEIDQRVASDMEADLARMGIGPRTSPRVVREALGMTPVPKPEEFDEITPRGWDYYKRAIQDLIDKEGPTSELGGALTELDNMLRQTVDTAVNPTTPAAGPWAQARAISGTGKQFAQGINDGSGVFSRPKTHNPDQVADDLARGGPVYETGYRAGARGDLANMMNDAGTQFGPAGDKAARKGLWSSNAERKVRQLAAQPRSADRLLRRRDAESTFGETQNAITGNSATSARLQAQKEFPNPVENDGSGAKISDTTVAGMLAGMGRKALNAMTTGAHNEKLRVMAENAARILSATGIQRELYFRGLEQHMITKGVSAQQAARVARAVESLMVSSVPTATGAATSPAR